VKNVTWDPKVLAQLAPRQHAHHKDSRPPRRPSKATFDDHSPVHAWPGLLGSVLIRWHQHRPHRRLLMSRFGGGIWPLRGRRAGPGLDENPRDRTDRRGGPSHRRDGVDMSPVSHRRPTLCFGGQFSTGLNSSAGQKTTGQTRQRGTAPLPWARTIREGPRSSPAGTDTLPEAKRLSAHRQNALRRSNAGPTRVFRRGFSGRVHPGSSFWHY